MCRSTAWEQRWGQELLLLQKAAETGKVQSPQRVLARAPCRYFQGRGRAAEKAQLMVETELCSPGDLIL